MCGACGVQLSRGSEASWDGATKEVTCLACIPDRSEPAAGVAGASAAAEGQRRKAKRVAEARRRYGDHAAAVAEAMAGRDAAASWSKGSDGESKLAAFVAREVGDAVIPLHDRLIPGARGNIDHIFVAPTGVWVVDAKAYRGKVVKREVGPIWRRDNEVFVGGRDRSALAKGVEKQVAAAIAALNPDPSVKGAPVYGALCFVESEWALLDFPFQVGNVWVLPRRAPEATQESRAANARTNGARRAKARSSLPAATSRR